jgi:hypothetical protein
MNENTSGIWNVIIEEELNLFVQYNFLVKMLLFGILLFRMPLFGMLLFGMLLLRKNLF